uniref:Uncharacterized protein n=1 Tax=Megaselia scalaris TaxID=36166 RepID=T1GMA3_MEGSC
MYTKTYTKSKTPDILEKQPPPSSKPFRGKPWKQILAALVANLGTVTTGLVFGFSAVAIPQLEAEDLQFKSIKHRFHGLYDDFVEKAMVSSFGDKNIYFGDANSLERLLVLSAPPISVFLTRKSLEFTYA